MLKFNIPVREFRKERYFISTDATKLHIEIIYKFLKNSYWAKDIPYEIVKSSIDNSFCFGVYKGDSQIGFARVITDFTTFAYLADVFILEGYRGKGLSKWLLATILNYPELQGLRGWMLKTLDAHELYRKFGFNSPLYPERIMEYSPTKNQ